MMRGNSVEKVFISYRRQHSWSYVRALYDRLSRHFGEHKVFMDLDDIPLGTDFVDVLDHNLGDCKAMLVVIDSEWLTIRDAQGNRRLDNPHDFVRLEVATALKRNISVIPILIDGTPMPSESALPDDLKLLPRRQALELTSKNYEHSVRDLIQALERYIQPQQTEKHIKPSPSPTKSAWYKRPWVLLLLSPVLVLVLLFLIGLLVPDETITPDKPSEEAIAQIKAGKVSSLVADMQKNLESVEAGFDCKAARSASEKAICSHTASRSSDAQLQTQYSQMLNLLPPDYRNDFRKDQQTWLRERDAYIKAYCMNQTGDAQGACITDVYQQRLDTLRTMQQRQFVKALVIDPPSNIRYKPNGSVRCQADSAIHIHVIRRAVKDNSGLWYWTNHCGATSWGLIHESQISF